MNGIWFVVPYFGPAPQTLDLWLASCAKNPAINWLVLSDFSSPKIPVNVRWEITTLREIVSTIFRGVGFQSSASFEPYKLCDFRPAFWTLLEARAIDYSHWGHCDLDVVFGRLNNYLEYPISRGFEKIYTFGHFTLYRNTHRAKNAFKIQVEQLDWKRVFSDEKSHGFDEHFGVNQIWEMSGLPQFEDESVVADIDPQFAKPFLTRRFANFLEQRFVYRDGRIFQVYSPFLSKTFRTREFAYIHLQKRKFKKVDRYMEDFTYAFLSDRITTLAEIDWQKLVFSEDRFELEDVSLKEIHKHIRAHLRYVRQGFHTSR